MALESVEVFTDGVIGMTASQEGGGVNDAIFGGLDLKLLSELDVERPEEVPVDCLPCVLDALREQVEAEWEGGEVAEDEGSGEGERQEERGEGRLSSGWRAVVRELKKERGGRS